MEYIEKITALENAVAIYNSKKRTSKTIYSVCKVLMQISTQEKNHILLKPSRMPKACRGYVRFYNSEVFFFKEDNKLKFIINKENPNMWANFVKPILDAKYAQYEELTKPMYTCAQHLVPHWYDKVQMPSDFDDIYEL